MDGGMDRRCRAGLAHANKMPLAKERDAVQRQCWQMSMQRWHANWGSCGRGLAAACKALTCVHVWGGCGKGAGSCT
eukprot:366072-Chlamydomonas_euryale.AAC.11